MHLMIRLIGPASCLILMLTVLVGCSSKKDAGDQGQPALTDEELLDVAQRQTFAYFWDYGHPVSGLTRERAHKNVEGTDEVTIGGSGFGMMAILVGIERGYISKEQGLDRLLRMTKFLDEKAERFHGAWSHWINGTTGETIPFSTFDDGGDLVETAFLFQGLLTVRQFFDEDAEKQNQLRELINRLWEDMEWDWYTQGGQHVLYWHWSPTHAWKMNHKINGWNEALIVYVLAASSASHGIDPEVYHEGWAKSGEISNGTSYYGITLPLGPEVGGPLFFAHYSFLGLDPRELNDQYANYWEQNTSHALINRQYCIDNPKKYQAYHEQCWGLTASYSIDFYAAHSPTNDLGVISPTAAISSMPYTPQQSREALRWMYEYEDQKLFGEYGFIDAFSISEDWYSDGYLAIDQGPIIIMIENYRSGMLWELFMSCTEVQSGLQKLGFTR